MISREYGEVLDIIKTYLKNYSIEDQNKVLGLNAIKFYNIQI